MDTALRTRIIAEAKFLRATHYFNLVRMFGGVPLKLHETQGLDSLAIPRNTAQEVYAQIEQDLKDAIAVLPSAKTYTAPTSAARRRAPPRRCSPRCTCSAPAPASARRPIGRARSRTPSRCSRDGDYSLVADYKTLFDFIGGTVQERNSEVIFDIECIRASGLGGRISSHMAPNAHGARSSARRRTDRSRRRASGSTRSAPTTSAATARSSSRGTRTARSCTWNETMTASQPYASETPFPRKFLDILMTGTGAEEPNYIVLRYAEVLLMIAEAANEVSGGPTAEAYTAVNAIRTRAGIPAMTPGLSHDLFRDSVFNERRWELSLEGPNGYFDSQRNWAWAKARIEQSMTHARSSSSKFPKANNGPIADKYKLMPIPQRAIDLNPALTGHQNPGW